MPIYSVIDEDKGGVKVGFESHAYREDGTELDEEWDKRLSDYIFSHQEQFPEFFDWIDQLIDDKIQREAEMMREEGRSEEEVKGFTIISNSLIEDKNLEALEKLTLIYIIKYYNEKLGYAFPSLETLRKLLGYSHQRYVREKIESLICKGYITKETVKQKNRYYLTGKVRSVPKVQNIPKVPNMSIGEVRNVPNSKVPNVPTKNTKNNTTNTNTSSKDDKHKDDSEKLWKLYPKKKGKQIAMKKIPKLLKQHGYEQLERCITRYKKDIEQIRGTGFNREYQDGSTFFNGKYEDYLDENCQEIEEKKPKEKVLTHEEYLKDLYN